MIFTETSLPGVIIVDIEPRRDERGFFARQWCADEFANAGLDCRVAQINSTRSLRAGTLRGMHYQTVPHAEVKLVRCTSGAIFDVAVDLRADSPTYCQWFGTELSEESGRMLYIPEGCGHGYLTLVPHSDVVYFASVPYAPGNARGVRHDDPALGIAWPQPITVLSQQDRSWPTLDPHAGKRRP